MNRWIEGGRKQEKEGRKEEGGHCLILSKSLNLSPPTPIVIFIMEKFINAQISSSSWCYMMWCLVIICFPVPCSLIFWQWGDSLSTPNAVTHCLLGVISLLDQSLRTDGWGYILYDAWIPWHSAKLKEGTQQWLLHHSKLSAPGGLRMFHRQRVTETFGEQESGHLERELFSFRYFKSHTTLYKLVFACVTAHKQYLSIPISLHPVADLTFWESFA